MWLVDPNLLSPDIYTPASNGARPVIVMIHGDSLGQSPSKQEWIGLCQDLLCGNLGCEVDLGQLLPGTGMVQTQGEASFEAAGFLFLIGGDIKQQFTGQQVVPVGNHHFTQQ